MSTPTEDVLSADCANCFGLCCVAPAFAVSADFAIDKKAGQPCVHLETDNRCAIHSTLRQRGFPGCAAYDCFGAGQMVSQVTYGGRDWREQRKSAGQMFDVFAVMRQLHELLWYLTHALALPAAHPLEAELRRAVDETGALTRQDPAALLALDLPRHRLRINPVLQQASEMARASTGRSNPDLRGVDRMGANLTGADLRGASLRGARLIGADLRGADLRLADFTGADVRNADLRGADLSGAIFVTQAQLDSARGDARTRLPGSLSRPVHWQQSP